MSVRRTVVTRYPTPATRGSEDPRANPVTSRETMQAARRVVVKIGSSSLTTPDGLDVEAIDRLVDVLAAERQKGTQVVLVSSGAVAAGFPHLGLGRRPKDTATQQASAAVGQSKLMAHYTTSFGRHDTEVAQVLLTAEELMRRTQYTNAHRALSRLLTLDVMPIVNENDAVATREIRLATTTASRPSPPTSARRTCWSCSRTWTPSTRATPRTRTRGASRRSPRTTIWPASTCVCPVPRAWARAAW